MNVAQIAIKLGESEKTIKKELNSMNLGGEKKESPSVYYEPYGLTKIDYILAGLLFIFALGVYVYTLSPGICAGDSGELTSAVFFLGGAHSPGYPLYCIVGKFFMNILPFLGRAVYRLNFFSAFGGALTVFGTFILLVKLLGRTLSEKESKLRDNVPGYTWFFTRIPALAASLYLLFSNDLWAQAVISEVYTLNSLFVPIFLILLLTWDEMLIKKPEIKDHGKFYWNQASKTIYAFYFLFAFSLGDHHIMLGLALPTLFFIVSNYLDKKTFYWFVGLTSLAYFFMLFNIINIFVPSFIIWFLIIGLIVLLALKQPKLFAIFGISLLFVGLGLLIYTYLPIRGAVHAPLHWGNPTNWDRFSNVVLRKQYKGFAQNTRSLIVFLKQIYILIKWNAQQFTPWLLVLVLPGIYSFFKRNKKWFWFTISFILYYDFALLLFNNFRFTPRDQFFAEVFWIPFYIITIIWIAEGIRFILHYILNLKNKAQENNLKLAKVTSIIFIVLAILPFHANIKENNLRHNRANDNYGLNLLMSLDKDAILFTEGGDNQVFSLLYHHLVEHLRPDVRIWDQKGNVFEGLYGNLMRITAQQLKENQITGDYSQWKTGRPIYYTWKDFKRINEINKRYYLSKGKVPQNFFTVGILYRMVPKNVFYQPLVNPWHYYKFDWMKYPEEAIHWDYLAREILANYNFQIGDRYLILSQKFKNLLLNPRVKSFNGIPRSQFIQKIKEYKKMGFDYYKNSTKYGYDMVAIHYNFAIFLERRAQQALRQGDVKKALELYQMAADKYQDAAKVDPKEMRAYYSWAVAYEKMADIASPNDEADYLRKGKLILEKAIKINDRYSPLTHGLKRIEAKLKYPRSKINELKQAITQNPHNQQNVNVLLQTYLVRNNINAAISVLEKVRASNPKNLMYLQYLASLYARSGHIDKTISYLKKIIKIQPNNPNFSYALAEIYYKQKKYTQAKYYYRKVVSLGNNPKFSDLAFKASDKLQSIENVK